MDWIGGLPTVIAFLLVVLAIFSASLFAAAAAWRLSNRLTRWIGIPERLLLSLGSFLLVGGCLPLVLVGVFAVVSRSNPAVGAAGIWAFTGIAAFTAVTLLSVVIAAVRLVWIGRSHSH